MTTERERDDHPVSKQLRQHLMLIMDKRHKELQQLAEDVTDLMTITAPDLEVGILSLFTALMAEVNRTANPALYRRTLTQILETFNT